MNFNRTQDLHITLRAAQAYSTFPTVAKIEKNAV